jgi:hypothetical protein
VIWLLRLIPISGLLLLCLAWPGQPQRAHYGRHDSALLPDLKATPGVITSLTKEQICSTKWGQDERHVTPSMKDQVCVAYGLKPHCYGRETNEIDHLISRELGGDDDVKNLWPQPYFQHPSAHEKDTVENWLHKQVCSGKLTLSEAQTRIREDWYSVYLTMSGGKK